MKIELEQHVGIRRDGVEVEFDQWRVFATGPDGARLLIGYLPHNENHSLMLLCNQPANVLREIITKCEAITKRKVISPLPIYEPPEIDNDAGGDEDTQYFEED
jgi:hypothetical protein